MSHLGDWQPRLSMVWRLAEASGWAGPLRFGGARGLTAEQEAGHRHQAAAERIDRLLGVTDDAFVVAGRPPRVESPVPVSEAEVEQQLERQAVEGIAWFGFCDRDRTTSAAPSPA